MLDSLSPPVKKTLLVVLAALGFALLVVGGILFGRAVGTPDQHNPEVYGTVQVRLDPSWHPDERARMEPQLARMNRLGPTFEWAPASNTEAPGRSRTVGLLYTAVVRRGDWGPDGCRTTGVAFYDTWRHVIWIDPVCAPGEILPAALGHELGHFLGMRHICRSAGERGAYQCSPVGYDRASIMNPSIALDPGVAELLNGRDPNAPPPLDPSFEDLAEFRTAIRAEATAPPR